ncbi:N-acetyllactosaminide alpha-1,3-galactosyltransferase-like [Antennarius striatus]|uniref:N-acetyllactosaminide alpha-1,3-galactosyltransferase-like n=1 Tax=Antennarius striatus TaxID=241820 RepID=UPI0035B4EEE3
MILGNSQWQSSYENVVFRNLLWIEGKLLRTNQKDVRLYVNLDHTLDFGVEHLRVFFCPFRARKDVQTQTYWRAPIIWEGMFDPDLYDQTHIQRRSCVALVVFALGRYLEFYLHNFLTSAEKHFMLGLSVTYYVFTDYPEKVPKMELGPWRSMKVLQVEKHPRWQDVSMMRMKTLAEFIKSDIRHHCNYVFCFDVDQVFTGRFGSEALGDSVALLQAYFYKVPQKRFTYERRPTSQAFLETGDFYYHAALFGGSWENMKNLTEACLAGIMEDKKNKVEAVWHDESHLNKYYWLHKPTRVLSPEYCWDRRIRDKKDILVTRLVWAKKHYRQTRV